MREKSGESNRFKARKKYNGNEPNIYLTARSPCSCSSEALSGALQKVDRYMMSQLLFFIQNSFTHARTRNTHTQHTHAPVCTFFKTKRGENHYLKDKILLCKMVPQQTAAQMHFCLLRVFILAHTRTRTHTRLPTHPHTHVCVCVYIYI